MNKKYKILIYLAGFLLLLLVAVVVWKGLVPGQTPVQPEQTSNPGLSTTTGQSISVPDYILSDADEADLKEFVKNFVNLYNTYSYSDFSNLTALGDYQTQAMQEKTLSAIENWQNTLPLGYRIATKSDIGSFSYKYPNAGQVIVQIKARVSETINDQAAPVEYNVTATLDVGRSQSGWMVKDITFAKN